MISPVGLHGVRVGVATPERNPQCLADRMTCTLMIGVCMRQSVQSNCSASKSAQDPSRVESRRRVDQDVAEQVSVDRVRRKAFQDVQVVSQLFHGVFPPVPLRHFDRLVNAGVGASVSYTRVRDEAQAVCTILTIIGASARILPTMPGAAMPQGRSQREWPGRPGFSMVCS